MNNIRKTISINHICKKKHKEVNHFFELFLLHLKDNGHKVLWKKNARYLDVDKKGKDSDVLFNAGLDYISLATDKAIYLKSKEPISNNYLYKKDYDVVISENPNSCDISNTDFMVDFDGNELVCSDSTKKVIYKKNIENLKSNYKKEIETFYSNIME